MTAQEDFLRYYAVARSLFPILKAPVFVDVANAETISFEQLNVAGIPQFCVPLGFDVETNQQQHAVVYHEAGHAYNGLLGLAHPGVDYLGLFRAFAKILPDTDIREAWAEVFANAVAGRVVTSKSAAEQAVDPMTARAWFQQFLPQQPVTPPTPAPAGFRHMVDALYAANIPDGYPVVAGYVDGTHPWSDADFARFSTVVRICIYNDRFDAEVIDVEGGNNDAKGAVPWVKGKWDRGQTPTVYCYSDAGPSGYRVSDVRAECDAAGVKRPLIWITRAGDGSSFDPAGDPEIVALQYEFDGAYDVSVIANNWPTTTTSGGPKVLPALEGDMTPDEVLALIEQKYDLGNTIGALKENDGHFADVLRTAAAAFTEAADKLAK